MTPSCSSISYFPSAQTRNSRNGPTATFPEDSIPAHAGKTFAQRDQPSPGPAHPRSRGENPSLPPLFRLIPAHAGKTCGGRTRRRQAAAHPRSRGENHWMPHPIDPSRGSSPLTRGKHFPFTLDDGTRRLIPAHAGKTRPRACIRSGTTAHPRSRGENPTHPRLQPLSHGSSPLTRGKHPLHPWRVRRRRLIPAHAGKTGAMRHLSACCRAHPRSRGENRDLDDNMRTALGSSPLTRGKRSAPARRGWGGGLIPAHAGKTG